MTDDYDALITNGQLLALEYGVHQRGSIVSTPDGFEMLDKSIMKVRSWQNKAAPKAFERMRQIAIANGAFWQCQFDAAHGFRYRLLFIPKWAADKHGSFARTIWTFCK